MPPETLCCLYCSFTTTDPMELLDHEDEVHGEMVELLEGLDGSESEEDITGEETEDKE